MGLMDREYMHRTPEEREAEYRQKRSKKQISEDQRHRNRQLEMYRLMAKGNSMTRSENGRLSRFMRKIGDNWLKMLPILVISLMTLKVAQ